MSAVNIETKDQIEKNQIEEKQKVIDKYKRIDQVTLTKVGIKQKQLLTEQAIPQIFNFTQLQRFRQNRDLLAFDKAKPISVNPYVSDDSEDDKDDSESDDDEADGENRNQQNKRFPTTSISVVNSAQKAKQTQNKQAIGEAQLRELEEKWWLQGDIEAVKRGI